MNSELKGVLIGGALVAGYVWWTQRRGWLDGRCSSSLDGSMPTSTLAAGWRGSGSSSWMNTQCPVVAPPFGGLGRLRVRGYGG